MNNSLQNLTLTEAKTKAHILLKQLNSSDINVSKVARLRLSTSQYSNLVIENLKLKHTLTIIANEYGFSTWSNLKTYFTTTRNTIFEPRGGFINQWFSNYTDAKEMLKQGVGYLLPYKNQFFICEDGYIEHIGLSTLTLEWAAIAYNWIEPNDMMAWSNLNESYNRLRSLV